MNAKTRINSEMLLQTAKDLTLEQVEFLRGRLDFVPTGDAASDYSELIQRYLEKKINLAVFKNEHGEIHAFCFFVIEECTGGKDLAILAGESPGKDPAFKVTENMMRGLENLAIANECSGISFRTIRPGFARLLIPQGYHVSEYIMRKIL